LKKSDGSSHRRPFRPFSGTLKPGDAVLAGLIFLGWIIWLFTARTGRASGIRFSVFSGDQRVYQGLLSEEKSVEVPGRIGPTRIVVSDLSVRIVRSPCPHRLCMHAGSIRIAGECLICLPNRIVVQIEGRDDRIDGVTQ
jgi:hypothetical protein